MFLLSMPSQGKNLQNHNAFPRVQAANHHDHDYVLVPLAPNDDGRVSEYEQRVLAPTWSS